MLSPAPEPAHDFDRRGLSPLHPCPILPLDKEPRTKNQEQGSPPDTYIEKTACDNAGRCGVDLSLIEAMLKRSVAERMAVHDAALTVAHCLRQSMGVHAGG